MSFTSPPVPAPASPLPRVLAFGSALLLALLLGLAVFTAWIATVIAPSGGVAQIGAGSPIPAGFVPLFNEAARVYDVNPYLLASVAEQESTFGTGPGWDRVNYAGCVGFMQTCVGGLGGDSWDAAVHLTASPRLALADRNAYELGTRPAGYPLERASHPDPDDPFDAIMAAAVELRAKVGGVPIPYLDGTAHRALCGYYGACADRSANYADDVLTRAQRWQAASALQPGTAMRAGTRGPDGLYFPIQPVSLAVPASSWTLDAGVDIATLGGACYPQAAEVAIATGTIIAEGLHGFGPYSPVLRIDSGPLLGRIFYYGHAAPDAPGISVGSHVQAGQVIAYVGCGDVGISSGPHIEFGAYTNRGTFPADRETSPAVERLLSFLGHAG